MKKRTFWVQRPGWKAEPHEATTRRGALRLFTGYKCPHEEHAFPKFSQFVRITDTIFSVYAVHDENPEPKTASHFMKDENATSGQSGSFAPPNQGGAALPRRPDHPNAPVVPVVPVVPSEPSTLNPQPSAREALLPLLHRNKTAWGMARWIASKRRKPIEEIAAMAIELMARETAKHLEENGRGGEIPAWIAKELRENLQAPSVQAP